MEDRTEQERVSFAGEAGLIELDAQASRPADRRTLVFLGDYVDRGPDSPGVVRLVRSWVEAGNAHAVVGNHEYRTPGAAGYFGYGAGFVIKTTDGGASWTQGNFNYDPAGDVNFQDLVLLAQRYRATLFDPYSAPDYQLHIYTRFLAAFCVLKAGEPRRCYIWPGHI